MRQSRAGLHRTPGRAASLFILLSLLLIGAWHQQPARPGEEPPTPQRVLPGLDPAQVRGSVPVRRVDAPGLAQPPSASSNLAPLTIVDYAPRGAVPAYARLQVRFNQPVASLEQVRSGADPGIALGFTPPLRGRLRFISPDLLEFKPEHPLPPARRLTAVLRGPITAPTGVRYQGSLSWSMETERPHVTAMWPESDLTPVGAHEPVLLYFEQPIQIQSVHSRLRTGGSAAVRAASTGTAGAASQGRRNRARARKVPDRRRWYRPARNHKRTVAGAEHHQH